MHIEGFVPLFICIEDLRVRAWFVFVGNLVVETLLGAPLID